MSDSTISKLLRRYKDGTCTETEKHLIEKWLEEQLPHNLSVNDEDIHQHLQKTKELIDQRLNSSKFFTTYHLAKIAALFLLLVTSVLLIWKFNNHKYKTVARQNISPGVTSSVKDGWNFITTRRGISYSDTLPDRSVVILNGGSVIRYPVNASTNRRIVYLDEGEALFNVAKDKLRPFTVYSPGFSTTALGTEFNIRTYKNEHKVAVSLLHGKILVQEMTERNYRKAHILRPNQQLILNSLKGDIQKSVFTNRNDIIGWEEKILTFKDADASEVINKIENHFNVVVINKSLKTSWSYTGTFKKETLSEVIQTISLTEDLNYRIHNQIITLY